MKKKWSYFALVLVIILGDFFIPTKNVEAASVTYPLLVPSSFTTYGKVGEVVSIEYSYLPYYYQEEVYVEVYNSFGRKVAYKSRYFYHSSRNVTKYTLTWDTNGEAPGTYEVKAYVKYHLSSYGWLTSSKSQITSYVVLSEGNTRPTTEATTQYTTQATTQATTQQKDSKNKKNGVGTISPDGKILTGTDGVRYKVAEKLGKDELKKNLKIADKKSGGKYKITKITTKNGKITGGTLMYVKPYNKNTELVSATGNVVIAGVKFTVTSIGNNAFKDCKKLSRVVIGPGVITIGKKAFCGTSNLNLITIKSKKITKIGYKAFSGTNENVVIQVPKSKKSKYTKMIKKRGISKEATII